MTVVKRLWLIILIKLFVFFFVLRLFFFPDGFVNMAGIYRAELLRDPMGDRKA
jgi:hypothetical protein